MRAGSLALRARASNAGWKPSATGERLQCGLEARAPSGSFFRRLTGGAMYRPVRGAAGISWLTGRTSPGEAQAELAAVGAKPPRLIVTY
jgi:hypothetical protein